MAIDTNKFVVAPSLEMYFINKDTGLPLSGGKVTFYKDNSRTVKKSVYQITGSPPAYTFIELPNPIILSSKGTIQNASGDNVLPYYYPFEGDPEDNTGIPEKYYITIESSGGVSQFTREGWPPGDGSGTEEQELINLVANPQFAKNNNFPTDPDNDDFVTITEGSTAVAPGGWWFIRPDASTANDSYKFVPFESVTPIPTGNPRYYINVKNTGGFDPYKYLGVRWNNVNMFASDDQSYTFNFYGLSSSGNITLDVKIVKFFGTGSSTPTSTTTIGQINLTNSFSWVNLNPFVFGSNDSDQVGDLNDDYVELVISLPTNQSFNFSFTDFILTPGNVTLENFPYKPYEISFPESTIGYPEDNVTDGSDLYLPILYTKSGTKVDRSIIGTIYALSYPLTDYDSDGLAPDINNISCIGNYYFKTTDYSPLGIPFSRLGNKYYDETLKLPIWGTGIGFSSAFVAQGASTELILCNNQFGTVSSTADGSSTTGFLFRNLAIGQSSPYNVICYITGPNLLWVKGLHAGYVSTGPDNGSSSPGFNFGVFKNPQNVAAYYEFVIEAISGVAAGDFITFSAESGSGNVDYVPWFTVDGSGSAPVDPGTKIQINIFSYYTSGDIANVMVYALSGCQVSSVVMNAASTVNGGDYWTFDTTGKGLFAVWYTKDGAGSKPSAPGVPADNYIKVELIGSDTAAQVADKTRIQINKTYFAVPNLAGAFLRGFDPDQQWDIVNDAGFSVRFGYGPGLWGPQLGTFEMDYYTSHIHDVATTEAGTAAEIVKSGATGGTVTNLPTSESGGQETRPINAAINLVVKY